MPVIAANPKAEAPDFNPVRDGDYDMRITKQEVMEPNEYGQSIRFQLKHVTTDGLQGIDGNPLKGVAETVSFFAGIDMEENSQGRLRKVWEATGRVWPTEEQNINTDELNNEVIKVRLTTQAGKDKLMHNKLARVLSPETA